MLGRFLSWGWTTRYTRSLETEVARLRGENLALMNSILGVAGVPPLRIDHQRIESEAGYVGVLGGVAVDRATASPSPYGRKAGGAPVRRRSWQQIGRVLEAEDASRKGEGSGGTLKTGG
jgi:hypothetical protein